MPQMHFEVEIACSPQQAFDTLADIAAYPDWLPPSTTFGTIRDVQPTPPQRGTTYTDAVQGPPMRGEITRFERPHALGFRQTTHLGVAFIKAELLVESLYTLTPITQGVQVRRDYQLEARGVLRLLEGRLFRLGVAENQRILATLRAYLES